MSSTKRIRALEFRSPAPEYEFADGTVVQTRYLDATGFQVLSAYEADENNVEKLATLLREIAPDLTIEYINHRVTFQDIVNLIAIGKGHADVVLDALKNGLGGGVPETPPPTPDSATTTPSHASSPA